MNTKWLLSLALCLTFSAGAYAQTTTAEQKVENTASDVGNAARKGTRATGRAAVKTGRAVGRAGKATGQGVSKAAKKTKDVVTGNN